MEEQSFMEIMFKGLTFGQFMAFFLWGLIGMVLSFALDIYSSGTDIKDIDFSYWLTDNYKRIIVSLIFLPVLLIFSEQFVEMQLTIYASFIIGFTADKIIENFKDRRKRKRKPKSNFS